MWFIICFQNPTYTSPLRAPPVLLMWAVLELQNPSTQVQTAIQKQFIAGLHLFFMAKQFQFMKHSQREKIKRSVNLTYLHCPKYFVWDLTPCGIFSWQCEKRQGLKKRNESHPLHSAFIQGLNKEKKPTFLT